LRIFLLAFLLIYGGFHLHFFLRIRAAGCMGGSATALLGIVLLVGLTAPPVIRLAEAKGYEFFARYLAIIGYYWMAFLLLFCVVSLFVAMYDFFLMAVAGKFSFNASIFIPNPGMRFIITTAAAVLLVVYGSVAARHLRTEFLTIHSVKIPGEIGRIRILQISDVHIGGAIGSGYLPGIIRAIRAAAPDVIVSTGDLVDGRGAYVNDAARMLKEITPRMGKFAITGNHEFYLGVGRAMNFMEAAGFVPLRNRVVTIAGVVDLVGVDDPGGIINGEGAVSDRDVLAKAGRGRFTILLKHRPIVEKDAIPFFNLQLSGHTHGGQIFPFQIFTKLVFPYHSGDFRLSSGALLHVNRGAGVWGPPVRLLAPPEITVIDLVSG
jgi:predicted MPP superfamily phosphohydrolase